MRLPVVGEHRCVVLTVNPMIARLGAVTVAVITGTEGPRSRTPPSNVTDLHTVDKARLRRWQGRLHPAEVMRIEGSPAGGPPIAVINDHVVPS